MVGLRKGGAREREGARHDCYMRAQAVRWRLVPKESLESEDRCWPRSPHKLDVVVMEGKLKGSFGRGWNA